MLMAGLPLPAPKLGLVLGYLAYDCLWLICRAKSNVCPCGTIRIGFFWSCIRVIVTFARQKVPHSKDWDSISPNMLETRLRRK